MRQNTLLLDRVAVGDAVRRRAGGQRHLDLRDRSRVEARAEAGEQREHFRGRVRLHGVEHAGIRQRLGESAVVVAHDVEVDDQDGAFVDPALAALTQKFTDALGHWRTLPAQGTALAVRFRGLEAIGQVRDGDAAVP